MRTELKWALVGALFGGVNAVYHGAQGGAAIMAQALGSAITFSLLGWIYVWANRPKLPPDG